MNWLEKIRGPKYLRYFFYIAYSWYRPYVSERGDAHFTALLFIAIPHIPIVFLIHRLVGDDYMPLDDFRFLIYMFSILAIHYYLFYYKGKWKKIIREFKHLDKKDRLKGTIYLLAYVVICFGTFFLLLIVNDKSH